MAPHIFLMLPKSTRAKTLTEYRPIASLRLLYKVFAYLLLGRIELPICFWAELKTNLKQHNPRSNTLSEAITALKSTY